MPGLIAKMNPPSDHDEDRCGVNGRLEGRAALITSADASIGRAMAIAYALGSADILISCCNEPDDARETACWSRPGPATSPARYPRHRRPAVDQATGNRSLVNDLDAALRCILTEHSRCLWRNAAMIPEVSTRDQDRRASGRDPDDPVLFYAERSFRASAATQGLPLLLWLPFLLALPEAIPIVLLSALGLVLWQHRAFRFELTATHLWFRAGAFTPTILIPLNTIHQVEPVDYWGRPLTWDQLRAIGSLRLLFPDGSSITVAGIREPREVVGAVRVLRDRGPAGVDRPE